jgi:hypothetical protein
MNYQEKHERSPNEISREAEKAKLDSDRLIERHGRHREKGPTGDGRSNNGEEQPLGRIAKHHVAIVARLSSADYRLVPNV